ncbi:MAG: type II toxin-antitoxin system RelE/ParE family toxin [Coriobacteriia bacterium]
MRIRWSDRALERVEEIAAYIEQDDLAAAARWVEQLFTAVDRLGDFPEMGKPGRDVLTPGIRELVMGDFRVFYEVGVDVDVHSVRRARQLIDEDEFSGAI